MQSILIIEDNMDTQLLISSILKENGYETFQLAEGRRIVSKFNECKPDIVLLDIHLPGEDGITILKKIKDIDRDVIVIMISGTR